MLSHPGERTGDGGHRRRRPAGIGIGGADEQQLGHGGGKRRIARRGHGQALSAHRDAPRIERGRHRERPGGLIGVGGS